MNFEQAHDLVLRGKRVRRPKMAKEGRWLQSLRHSELSFETGKRLPNIDFDIAVTDLCVCKENRRYLFTDFIIMITDSETEKTASPFYLTKEDIEAEDWEVLFKFE